MGNLLKSEWFKLKNDQSFRVLTILLTTVAILFPLLEFDGNQPSLPTIKDYYLTTILSVHTDIIKLIPSILAGFFITSEYSLGTMKSIASSGNSRIRIYFAKLIMFSVGAVTLSLILPLIMTGASAIYFGFHEMPPWTFYLQTVGLIALYGAGFASIMVIFATIFTDSGKTIGFLLLLFLMVDWPLQVLAAKVPFFEPAVHYSVFRLVYDITNASQLNSNEWITMIAVPVLTFLGAGLIGSIIFYKKEVK
ncbi:ABC transporter permease [Halobacillus karajensis]|uniref:Lantibiotic protection ABC transporter permease subunit, MutG family n=1 Tax=Halobacillus karajensis TaxID=195088 RepID=A0A059NVL4_9BACI|nr:ABC transporter permease [Halobacillus karajensis]CDQ18509.1 lantibiotic protection ABC transporter permease subunit, MutG family [Halobacillus karajensis]CDQ23419.1 lantibiotic protection ABC transporter permease subunit, MutG family [Halobacillus karajensis]CDQ26901.1 lantibiotic protection ABC transporter permease subunit, MutG family [Halobacillus karajensis]